MEFCSVLVCIVVAFNDKDNSIMARGLTGYNKLTENICGTVFVFEYPCDRV